jgi:hypothetical protein
MKNYIWIGIGLALIVVLFYFIAWNGDFSSFRYSRNLGCGTFSEQRTREICSSLERYSEYEWFGHAMVSAGYRVTFETARKTWCELDIRSEDRDLLEKISRNYHFDARIQNGFDYLLRILNGKERPDPKNQDIFYPGTSGYILEKGCAL